MAGNQTLLLCGDHLAVVGFSDNRHIPGAAHDAERRGYKERGERTFDSADTPFGRRFHNGVCKHGGATRLHVVDDGRRQHNAVLFAAFADNFAACNGPLLYIQIAAEVNEPLCAQNKFSSAHTEAWAMAAAYGGTYAIPAL